MVSCRTSKEVVTDVVLKQGGLRFRQHLECILFALIEKGLGVSLFLMGLSWIVGHTDKEVQGTIVILCSFKEVRVFKVLKN